MSTPLSFSRNWVPSSQKKEERRGFLEYHSRKGFEEDKKVANRETEPVASSSIAVPRIQSSVVFDAGSGSENSFIVVHRTEMSFEFDSDTKGL